MLPKAKRTRKFETEWLRAYARTYMPTEGALSFCAEQLRRAGVNLVEIRNACRSGRVVYADKLDDAGATWIVEGDDGDGRRLQITLVVISDMYTVSVLDVIRLQSEQEESDDGDDAA